MVGTMLRLVAPRLVAYRHEASSDAGGILMIGTMLRVVLATTINIVVTIPKLVVSFLSLTIGAALGTG